MGFIKQFMNREASLLASRETFGGVWQNVRFLWVSGSGKEAISQRKRKDYFSGGRDWKDFYHVDDLSNADQEISDGLLTGHIPGETETIIQSLCGWWWLGGMTPFRTCFVLLKHVLVNTVAKPRSSSRGKCYCMEEKVLAGKWDLTSPTFQSRKMKMFPLEDVHLWMGFSNTHTLRDLQWESRHFAEQIWLIVFTFCESGKLSKHAAAQLGGSLFSRKLCRCPLPGQGCVWF